jgi:hypothetical protein
MTENAPENGVENPDGRYDGINDVISGMLDGKADFEIRIVSGPEGRELSVAQARAVRGLLEWVEEQAREQSRDERSAA